MKKQKKKRRRWKKRLRMIHLAYLNAIFALKPLRIQLWQHAVIFIAGNVFLNGLNNRGKLLFVQVAGVEFHRISLHRFSLRIMKLIRVFRIIKVKARKIMSKFRTGQVDSDPNHNLTETLEMEAMVCLVIKLVASLWALAYSHQYSPLTSHGTTYTDQIELLQEDKVEDRILAIQRTWWRPPCNDSSSYSCFASLFLHLCSVATFILFTDNQHRFRIQIE